MCCAGRDSNGVTILVICTNVAEATGSNPTSGKDFFIFSINTGILED